MSVVLRIVSFNFRRLRDADIHVFGMSVLANMASAVEDISAHTSQKLMRCGCLSMEAYVCHTSM